MYTYRETRYTKQSKLKKVNKIWWARRVDHSSGCKPLPTIHSGNYIAYTATKLDQLKLSLSYTETHIDGQSDAERL